MKVTFLVSALAAVSSVSAFPFLSPSGNSDLRGLANMLRRFDQGQIDKLTNSIKEGMAQAGADIPKSDLPSLNFNDLTPEKIYAAFGELSNKPSEAGS